jgi:PAS domain S-box-containing protein
MLQQHTPLKILLMTAPAVLVDGLSILYDTEEMNTMEPSVWNRRLQRLAWLPIPLLLLAIGVFWVADLGAVYEPPYLMAALNLLFMLPVALFVAYQTGRSFLLRGHPGLLWFSCGILFWGSAGPLSGWLLPYGPGAVVTVHNILIGLAAVCHLAGVAFAHWLRPTLRWPEMWLAGAYAGVLTLIVVLVLATLSGGIPVFFIQGEGGTPLRQIVLGWAVALFVLTAILLMRNPGGTRSAFQYWYALALLLIAIGSFGVMMQSNLGGPLGWTGRFAQYLGSTYLMVAAVVGMRENRDWGRLLEAALGEATRRIEELLDRFNRIAATVPGVICSFRRQPNGNASFPYASPAIQDLYGLSPEVLAESAAPLWVIIHPDDLERLNASIEASAQTMTPWRDEFRVRHPSKGEIWVEGHSMPVRESDGSLIWHGYVQDITERKRAEQQLFETHSRLEALLQALPVGVSFSDDSSCQHIIGNPMLLTQFEMTPQDNVSASAPEATAAGRQVRYFHHRREISNHELPLQRAVAENQVIPATELEIQLPSGRNWWAEVIGAPLRDVKNQIIGGLAVVIDITERKRAETALRAALEEHEVLLREVHHRVKNNLAAIIGLLELQRERALDPATVSQMEELGHRIRSMALIHEMLYQSGNLSRVDFRDYLEALVGHLRDALDPSGAIRIHITAPEVWMNLDTAIPCGLIVNELVTNALKYAFPDHRRAASACEIFIAAEWDGAAYTLTITDNGVGLPADLDWTTTPTLGVRLIRMLGQHQLRGQLTFDGTHGTRFSLRFGLR